MLSRLPIIQGGCHKFIPAVAALMALPMWKCPTLTPIDAGNVTGINVTSGTEIDRTEVWQMRMREVCLFSVKRQTRDDLDKKSNAYSLN